MNDEYLPNMHPAITRRAAPMSPRAGARGPSSAAGGIDPRGLGSAGSESMFTEDMRQSDPYYLDFAGPRQSLESGTTAFNRAVSRKFGRAINPAELLERTNPTNSRAVRAPQPVVPDRVPAAEAIGRIHIGYDAHTREEPGSKARYGGMEVQNQLQYDHLVKKAHEANRLEELQRARRLRLRAANHERVAAMATVAPELVAAELPDYTPPDSRNFDVSGRPSSGRLPPIGVILGLVGVVTAMVAIPAYFMTPATARRSRS